MRVGSRIASTSTRAGRAHFREAANIAQLNLTLEGSMGKRTKFQVDSKPQLRVAEATSSDGTTPVVPVPESSELNEDSVLLEDVAFDDQKRRANVQDPRRAALTSCVALALCLDVRNTNPDDGLLTTRWPYVAFALASPWTACPLGSFSRNGSSPLRSLRGSVTHPGPWQINMPQNWATLLP